MTSTAVLIARSIANVLLASIRLSLLGLAALWLPAAMARGEDWPTFRGADRNGLSRETGLLDRWGPDGPRLVWTAQGAGSGYASTAVAGNRVYTLGDAPSTARDQEEYLSCFDFQTGRQLWLAPTGPAWNGHPSNPSWNGARSTPTIDGSRICVINPHGTLWCFDSRGQALWQKDLTQELGGKKHDGWGYSESPLIDGDLVLCTPGAKWRPWRPWTSSRETRWTCSRPGDVGAGHSSMVISRVGGRKIYVQNTGGGPFGVAADTGELLWSYDIPAPVAFIPSPIVVDDLVFTVAGYGTGGALLRQIPGNGGQLNIQEVYGLNRELDNKHGVSSCWASNSTQAVAPQAGLLRGFEDGSNPLARARQWRRFDGGHQRRWQAVRAFSGWHGRFGQGFNRRLSRAEQFSAPGCWRA